jgi:hypothetical protein
MRKVGEFVRTSREIVDEERRKSVFSGSRVREIVSVNAFETTGVVDAQCQLRLDEPLPITGPSRVRVIILVPDAPDLDDHAWVKAASASPAFDFLHEAAEDIYSLADGKAFEDQG